MAPYNVGTLIRKTPCVVAWIRGLWGVLHQISELGSGSISFRAGPIKFGKLKHVRDQIWLGSTKSWRGLTNAR